MKRNLVLIFFLASLAVMFQSCKEDTANPTVTKTYNAFDANHKITITLVNSFSDGLAGFFNKYYAIDDFKAQLIGAMLENARFLSDNSGYIYCYDTNQTCVAHPIDHSREGKNYIDAQDSHGKYYAREMSDSLRTFGYGTIHHFWTNPETGADEEKIAYVNLIDGSRYYLGSGFFASFMDGWSIDETGLNKEIARQAVQATAQALSHTFQTFDFSKTKQVEFMVAYMDSVRFFDDNSGYFFVDDTSYFSIVFPTNKSLEGTSLYDYTDSKGNHPVRLMVDVIKANGKGYVEYYYINPNTGKEQKKIVFIERIEGTEYFIGAGVYIE
jgi:signal transduction histidine kinase